MEEPIDRAVRILNEALEADPKAINRLMDSSVPVNDKLANHPSIQVRARPDASGNRLRPLGLIDGLFGTRDDSYGHIAMVCLLYTSPSPRDS